MLEIICNLEQNIFNMKLSLPCKALHCLKTCMELAAAKSEALLKQYLSSPAGEDRLRLENRIGALQEKIRDLSTKESRLAERFRTVLTDELASTRHALALEKLRTTSTF